MTLITPVYLRLSNHKTRIWLLKSDFGYYWSDIDATIYLTQNEAINTMRKQYPHQIFCNLPKENKYFFSKRK